MSNVDLNIRISVLVNGVEYISPLEKAARLGGVTLPPYSHAFEGQGKDANTNKSQVYAVENNNLSGAGSLPATPPGSYAIFPNGIPDIVLMGKLTLSQDDIWVMGQTAPNGVQIRGSGAVPSPAGSDRVKVQIEGSDVIFQHMAVFADETSGSNSQNRCLDIIGNSAVRRVVITDNSFYYGDDHIVSSWYDVADVSWLNNLMALGVQGFQQNYAMLIGGGSQRQTVSGNLFMGHDRNPIIQNARDIDVDGNLFYTSGNGPAWQSNDGSGGPLATAITTTTGNCVGNLIIRHSASASHIYFQERDPATHTLRVHVDNNFAMVRGGDPTVAAPAGFGIYGGGGGNPANYQVNPRYPLEQVTQYDPRTELFGKVTGSVGASHNRGTLDNTVISSVTNGTVIATQSTVAGYGGYPTLVPPATAKANIWDLSAVDKISDAIKNVKYGLPAGSDTTQTFTNGGTSCDFLAILKAEGYL